MFPALFLAALSFSHLASASQNDIHTFAGTGSASYAGDNGPATLAGLNSPAGIASDSHGNVYVADRDNNCIRKVDTNGIVTTIAGTGVADYTGDSKIRVRRNGRIRILRRTKASVSALDSPGGVAVDASGNIYIADTGNNRIRKVDTSGNIYTIAGDGASGYSGDGGPARFARVNLPESVAVDSSGNVYIADTFNNRIRMIDPKGVITTAAGTGAAGHSGDGGSALSARLDHPADVALDRSGNLYIADYYNLRVRKLAPSGVIATVAGNGSPGSPANGAAASSSSLNYPAGVAVDAAGTLYISDESEHVVRKVDASGAITTFAGGGGPGLSGDGGPAPDARLDTPAGVVADPYGNVYIADGMNNRIRMVEGPAYVLPVSTLLSPTTGDTVTTASREVAGKASAADGVAFVEVSTDGGSTWNTASGGETFSYAWTPQSAGDHILLSRSTDSLGRREKIMSSVEVTVNPAAQIVVNSLSASIASPADAGDTVVWTASATGGSGSLQYQFSRSGPDTGGGYVVTRDWGVSNSWTWATTGPMAGDSVVMVRVRNADGSGQVSKSVSYTVVQAVAAIVIGSLSPSMPAATAGDTLTWTVAASGGSGSLEYQFSRSGPDTGGTYVVTRAFGTSGTWSWTTAPSMAGSNTIRVDVRNSDGSGQVSKTAAYTVSAKTASSLVGYWKFDEASGVLAGDSSGLGNAGTLNGASRVSGVSGNAVSFDGTGTCVLVPGTAALRPASTVSVTAWVKTATTPAEGGEVVSMGDNYVLRVLSDGNVFFFIYNGTAWTTVKSSGVNVKDGQWHYLAGVKTAGQLQVYVDGALKAVKSTADTVPYALGTDLYIGRHGNASAEYNFNGTIDEVRVYDRDLSASEVQALHAGYTPPSPPQPSPATSYYGSGINTDSLYNVPLNSSAKTVSYRIRATHTGDLKSVRGYVKFDWSKPGYHSGTGGTVYVEIRADDGTAKHLPSNTVLASYTHKDPLSGGYFPLITFSSPPQLREGQFYHVVWKNIDPNPGTNWVSMNENYMFQPLSPIQPTVSSTDMAVLVNYGSGFSLDNRLTPIIELDYGDGFSQGIGYMEIWRQSTKSISGGTAVRQTFTVSGPDRNAASLSVRLSRSSGTGGLGVRLERADGTLIEQGIIPASEFSAGDILWGTLNFAAAHTLVSGGSYNVVLTAPSDTVYKIFPIRKGGDYGFTKSTYFHDGHAQFNSGDGVWRDWNAWSASDYRKTGDLQFYFKGSGSTPTW